MEYVLFMPQHSLMFNSIIRQNLTYGKPDATDEEMHEEGRNAAIHDTIMQRAQNYDAAIRDDGK
ncbi:uncharacterized protein PV07_08759 [Cladophialophora immunda]|uniref:Uncharacterized protein n=1 Tax=Cladophialophora immunda TaxID=569365 RepID=A0A0D2C321_9EURO|nr:uncharacterized protein PV07_08759 [Cladophialophora immunda]KIW25593.1 hypothetical protein PV07_08759 [Cladophialophora immunda]